MLNDIPALATWVQAQQFSLQLSVDRVAFLMAVVFLNEHQLDGAFDELTLIEAFSACDAAFGHRVESKLTRANHAINDLVAQRLLLRFSGSLVELEAIYRLTPLGLAIADHYLADRRFSAFSLSVQLQQVVQGMQSAAEAAQRGADLETWHQKVFTPLRYLVAEIFDRIDQNQRLLDLQQEQTKLKISTLLSQQWSEALVACEQLLAETSSVLNDLKETLEAVGHGLQAALLKIQEEVLPSPDLKFIAKLVQDLQRKLDRILGWGERTIEIWARYDKHVHKFLRMVIALDQNRLFSQRLRDSIACYLDSPWQLVLISAEKFLEYDPTYGPLIEETVIGELPPPLQLSPRIATNMDTELEDWWQQWQRKEDPWPLSLCEELRLYLIPFPPTQHRARSEQFIRFVMKKAYSSPAHDGKKNPWYSINTQGLEVQSPPMDSYHPDE